MEELLSGVGTDTLSNNNDNDNGDNDNNQYDSDVMPEVCIYSGTLRRSTQTSRDVLRKCAASASSRQVQCLNGADVGHSEMQILKNEWWWFW